MTAREHVGPVDRQQCMQRHPAGKGRDQDNVVELWEYLKAKQQAPAAPPPQPRLSAGLLTALCLLIVAVALLTLVPLAGVSM